MRGRTIVCLLVAMLGAGARLAAQGYTGYIESAGCSTVTGWAWDSTRPNTAITVDLYDYITPVATVTAGNYRADLYAAGYGNGYHGFSFTIPPYLKDGNMHVIDGYFGGTQITLYYTQSFTCAAGSTGYQYYYTDPLTSINSSDWTQNGSVSATSSGLTATSTNGGSLISKVTVPDGTSDYDVKTTLTLAATGGTYVSYLRASNNAMTGPGTTGTFYSVEVTPTISGGSCSATFVINKTVSGSVTQLQSLVAGCHSGMTVQSWIQGTLIGVTEDSTVLMAVTDSSITSGSAGLGALATPSGNSIASASLGPADRIAPQAPVAATIATSVLPTRLDVKFAGVSDDANGTGVAAYWMYKDGTWMAASLRPEFSDETLTAGTSHTYIVYAIDFRENFSTGTTFNITTPPAGSVDPRRVGLRPTATFWGATPEQIDVLSGNLNFTIPLLSAQGRNGWAVPFSLSYNSQSWRQDSGGTWSLGSDVGYGYGWRLSAGSILPYFYGAWGIDHYGFVDASGAEYRLDQNNSGIWSSKESLYVWFDANANILHFRDGSFWMMGCTSSGSEPDAGTLYPTTIENSNGNQILVNYYPGNQLPYTNSSARIQTIQDVRAVVRSGPTNTYEFLYTTDVVPHLTSIQNAIGTSEGYLFSFAATQALKDPFSGTAYNYSGGLTALQSVTVVGISMQHSFLYDQSGEMTQVTFPYGGYFKYNYGSVTYSSGFTQREVQSRILSKDGTVGSEITYAFSHESGSSSQPVHQFTTLVDPGGVGQKHWIFSQSGASIGLTTSYQGQQLPGPNTLIENDFTWTQDANSNFYISSTLNTYIYPPGPYQTQSKSTQTVDVYGNVTQVNQYTFGNLTTPVRTYTYSYLNSSNYTSRYIYNRLLTASVTDGTNNVTLANNSYDGVYMPPVSGTPTVWDSTYATQPYRGNLTYSNTPSGTSSYAYDQTGNPTTATTNNVTTTVTTTSTTNFATPSQMTVGSLTQSMNWTSFLGLSSATGANGDTISTAYDTYARPTTTTSAFGAVTSYAYSAPPFNSSTPATVTMTTNGRWTRNTLDGFGRTIKTENGDASGTHGQSESVYGPCACSPIGKLMQQSMTHAPGASTPTWTTYTYDGIGRTLTAATVGSDTQGTTSYAYYSYNSTDLDTLVTDPAGKWKLYITDALNNIAVVYEPPTPSESGGAYTYYYYDLLNHLTGVYMQRTAGTQTRSFVYSGNNLMSATNPENGTVSYSYNSYNKVATKTDAKGQQVVYTYDTLARLTEVQRYPTGTSNPEAVCQRENYYYDTNPFSSSAPYSLYTSGRLTAVQYYGGSTMYGYTNGGPCDTTFTDMYGYSQAGAKVAKGLRVSRNNLPWYNYPSLGLQSTGSAQADLSSTYMYDNEGRMTSVQYPGYVSAGAPVPGPNLGWTRDTMGRLSTMTDLASSASIIGTTTYGPSNELLSMSGVMTETRAYNSMLQLTQVYSNASSGLTYVNYNYPSTLNNGKIASQTDNVSGEQVVYTYDALNRLATAVATSSAWGQSYSYDGFGNLTDQTVIAGSAPAYHVTPDPTTNHLGAVDLNGNTLAVMFGAYDVENRFTGTLAPGFMPPGGYQYSYAPGNKRVWRGVIDSSGTTLATDEVTFWSVTGQKLASYNIVLPGGNGPGTPPSIVFQLNVANYYFGGKMVGHYTSAYGLIPISSDRLGSVGKYYPYGLEKPSATQNGTEKFTGYFRDSETGFDYAVNRYHDPGTGRFLTDDPSAKSWNPADPGSWNTYAYVGGDPINLTDPNGLSAVTLPPVVTGTADCSTGFIQYAAEFGETVQQLFDSDAGILGMMSFFEQEGSGSAADQQVWADVDWVFLNRWALSPSDKVRFYGRRNVPGSFAASVTSGPGRSQVFTSGGQLTAGFTSQLYAILGSAPDSPGCQGLARAFDVAQGTVDAYNNTPIPGLAYIPDPVPGALQFGSNGVVPTHGIGVTQTALYRVQDGKNSWTFYGDTYSSPLPRRPVQPRNPR